MDIAVVVLYTDQRLTYFHTGSSYFLTAKEYNIIDEQFRDKYKNNYHVFYFTECDNDLRKH